MKTEIEGKKCVAGCCYGMNSKCEILEIKNCGCEIHQKSFYSSAAGYESSAPHPILCKAHRPDRPIPAKMGAGYCLSCESHCLGDCGNFQPEFTGKMLARKIGEAAREANFRMGGE